jgi:hypothetical protein
MIRNRLCLGQKVKNPIEHDQLRVSIPLHHRHLGNVRDRGAEDSKGAEMINWPSGYF